MKKMFALLLAAMMLLAMMPAAIAEVDSFYTPITNITENITHTLELNKSNATALDCDITYTFVVSPDIDTSPSFADINKAVVGTPSIAGIKYTPSSEFTTSKTSTVNLDIDWSNVKIYQPGIYRWQVTKSKKVEGSTEDASNNWSTFYLYVYATAPTGDSTEMGCTVWASVSDSLNDKTQSTDKGNLKDTYPARVVSLKLEKKVTGNQGSRDQYFKFSLSLTAPSGAFAKTYDIGGIYDEEVPLSAYNTTTGQKNQKTITLSGGSATTIDIWLKHGQYITISDLTYGTAYTIVETAVDGYSTTSAVEGDPASALPDVTNGVLTMNDTSLNAAATVTYTNHKETPVPTGIELETTAPIVGMILAMAMLALLFIGKRKEEMA